MRLLPALRAWTGRCAVHTGLHGSRKTLPLSWTGRRPVHLPRLRSRSGSGSGRVYLPRLRMRCRALYEWLMLMLMLMLHADRRGRHRRPTRYTSSSRILEDLTRLRSGMLRRTRAARRSIRGRPLRHIGPALRDDSSHPRCGAPRRQGCLLPVSGTRQGALPHLPIWVRSGRWRWRRAKGRLRDTARWALDLACAVRVWVWVLLRRVCGGVDTLILTRLGRGPGPFGRSSGIGRSLRVQGSVWLAGVCLRLLMLLLLLRLRLMIAILRLSVILLLLLLVQPLPFPLPLPLPLPLPFSLPLQLSLPFPLPRLPLTHLTVHLRILHPIRRHLHRLLCAPSAGSSFRLDERLFARWLLLLLLLRLRM